MALVVSEAMTDFRMPENTRWRKGSQRRTFAIMSRECIMKGDENYD
jgi:hypothetical protein